jgi:SAM-dependent methyltransferase
MLYRDKDYKAETDYITTLLQRFAVQGSYLLEFGSGTGMHGRLLAGKGYHVFGIERSPEMVSRARQTPPAFTGSLSGKEKKESLSGSFECIEGDIRDMELNRTFDAVLALFHVISYLTTSADIKAAFKNANKHLKPGGIFFFDVWYTPAVLSQIPEIRIKRIEDEQVRIIRLAEPTLHPNQNLVDVQYTVLAEEIATHTLTTIEETHHVRHFSLPELEMLANFTGFTLLHSEEFLTANPPGENTWGVCCVLRKE